MIPYSRQTIDNTDIKLITKVLKKKLVTTGPNIVSFENKIKKFVDVKYAVAVNSATSALHIACLSLGLKSGDYLWTVPNSFVASANCGLYCGAKVDFVDIDINTYNISIYHLKQKLKLAEKKKKLPKVIVIVNFAGEPCELKEIKKLSIMYKFKVLEDSSHALGSKFKNHKIGNCKFSDISVFSFHPVKIITTLEGGMAVTNNKFLFKKMEMLRSHGITREEKFFKVKSNNKWFYEQQYLGFNYRMNEVEATLGISQLKRINKFFKQRLAIKKYYDKNLKSLPLILPKNNSNNISSLHLYVVLMGNKFKLEDRNKFIKYLRKKKIITNVHYIPIHLHPYFRKLGFKKGMFPSSEQYYERAVSLPIFPFLKINQLKYITSTIKNFFKSYE